MGPEALAWVRLSRAKGTFYATSNHSRAPPCNPVNVRVSNLLNGEQPVKLLGLSAHGVVEYYRRLFFVLDGICHSQGRLGGR